MRIFLSITLVSVFSSFNANAWTLFGPKTYEECIQKNMKGISSDTAATAVEYACYVQFQEAKDKAIEQEKIKRLEKCNLPSDISKYRMVFNIDRVQNLAFTKQILNDIKNFSLNRNNMQLSFQNNNSFGIAAMQIGFTKNKSCPSKLSDFEVRVTCTAGETHIGVSGNSYGSLTCPSPSIKDKNLGFCLIGYSPAYERYNDSLVKFMEKTGYCGK